jgi:hypothetical protein
LCAHAMRFPYSRVPTAVDSIYSTQDPRLPASRRSWGLARSFIFKGCCAAVLRCTT